MNVGEAGNAIDAHQIEVRDSQGPSRCAVLELKYPRVSELLSHPILR